jgi:hypothetical protein
LVLRAGWKQFGTVERFKQPFIYVDESRIHGKGLFARKHIGARELIGILDGVPTSTDGEHVLWLGEENEFHVCQSYDRYKHIVRTTPEGNTNTPPS